MSMPKAFLDLISRYIYWLLATTCVLKQTFRYAVTLLLLLSIYFSFLHSILVCFYLLPGSMLWLLSEINKSVLIVARCNCACMHVLECLDTSLGMLH